MGCLLENSSKQNNIDSTLNQNPIFGGKTKLYVKRLSVRLFVALSITVITFSLSFGVFLMLDIVRGANVNELMFLSIFLGLTLSAFYFLVIERSKLILTDDRIIVYRTCGSLETFLLDDFAKVYTKRIYNGDSYIGKTQYLCFYKRNRRKKIKGERKLNLSFLKHDDIAEVISEVYRKCRPHISSEYNALTDKGFKEQSFSFNRMQAVDRITTIKNRMVAFYFLVSLFLVIAPILITKFLIKTNIEIMLLSGGVGLVIALIILVWLSGRENYYKKLATMTPTMIEIKSDGIAINSEEFLHKGAIKFVNITPGFMKTLTMVKVKTSYGRVKFIVDAIEGNDKSENNRLVKVLEFWCDYNQITYNEGD